MSNVNQDGANGVEAHQIEFVRGADDRLSLDNFRIAAVELAPPTPGQVLVENLWMSVDPYMRLSMTSTPGLHATLESGSVPPGAAVGRVVGGDGLAEGTIVLNSAGAWRDRYLADATSLTQVDPGMGPVQRWLGVYGLTGITAWGGCLEVLAPAPGETMFVSGAAGAVGSVVVQLARAAGSNVIATAGSDEKGRWLTQELGATHFVNYKTEPVGERIRELAPDGIDTFFDNVGGPQLEIAIDAMKPFGRIALCGAVAQYEDDNYRAGPSNLFAVIEKNVAMIGFNAGRFRPRAAEIVADLGGRIDRGELVWQETVTDGFENAPQAFLDMLDGANVGKMLIRMAH